MILVYTITNFYYWTVTCHTQDAAVLDHAQAVLSKFTASWFLFLSIIFFTSGVIMICALQSSFPDFLKQFKCLMWTTTILISLPLSIRSIIDFSNLSTNLDGPEHFWASLYNFLFFLFTTYLPILFQICTLVFGFVRRKQAKQRKRTESEANMSLMDETVT